MLKFDLIPGGRHEVPSDEDKTDPKLTPKLRHEQQIHWSLHPWPQMEALVLHRLREHKAAERCVVDYAALWYVQSLGRFMRLVKASDPLEKERVIACGRSYDWASRAICGQLSVATWELLRDKVFTYITYFRPARQDDPPEIDDVFIALMHEVALMSCTSKMQIERLEHISRLRQVHDTHFLSPDYVTLWQGETKSRT